MVGGSRMVSPADDLTKNETLSWTEGEWVRVLCGYSRMVSPADDLTKNEITLLELKVSEAGRGRGQ